ncbi:MAG: site-specific integrase [Paramuribaculum sp.]|nr:site-specific integrase [Paramuribaculum sp.]MDE6489362.1 site-specific integrase [Paramuribaculum sp.]
MASIKVKFRPSAIPGHQGSIYYQIIHERRVRQLQSTYRIYPFEWDERSSMVKATDNGERRLVVVEIRERIRWDVERVMKISRKFDDYGYTYTADDIIEEFSRYKVECSLFNFMKKVIARLKHNGRIRTSETYTATLNSYRKFRQDEDIMLDSLTADDMEAYEAWLRRRGLSPNTVSFYIRILRAVYNRAVEENLTENRNPFRHVYTGIDKTVKRALPLPLIRKIRNLDLSFAPALDYARDMFILSFYLRGMSFIDMAFLKKNDLSSGRIVYRRRKTGQRLNIAWTKEMQSLVDKYPANDTDYLLPIIRNSRASERYIYRNTAYNINHNLKKVARLAGIAIPLTLYVARHSWASVARSKGIPLSVISEGMGHDSESTTQIYLASLDTTVVDRANSLILRSLEP